MPNLIDAIYRPKVGCRSKDVPKVHEHSKAKLRSKVLSKNRYRQPKSHSLFSPHLQTNHRSVPSDAQQSAPLPPALPAQTALRRRDFGNATLLQKQGQDPHRASAAFEFSASLFWRQNSFWTNRPTPTPSGQPEEVFGG